MIAGCIASNPSVSEQAPDGRGAAGAFRNRNGPRIRWVALRTDTKQTAVEVEGLASATLQALRRAAPDRAGWEEILSIHVDPGGKLGVADLPPVLGYYEVLEDRIRFKPEFPLQPGLKYRAELRTWRLPDFGAPNHGPTPKPWPVTASFQSPSPAKLGKTVVQQIYPTAGELPENLLKFYIHFSGPMRRGNIYDHIHLLNASGQPVELPFLEIDEELWNPELNRLTLFIDPGRIKRGVTPLEEIGPAIESGKRYTLVIDRDWQDSDGALLRKSYRKHFKVSPPDRNPPKASDWSITPPLARTRRPVVIRFAEPMDHALAQRLIWVVGPDRRRVAGRIAVLDQERQWSFVPDQAWQPGLYQIVAGTVLEDLAGNSLGRPFEVDVFDRIQKKLDDETVALPFEVQRR